jgi:hypothetical protein
MRTSLPFPGRARRLAASVAASWLVLMVLAAPSPASTVARADARGPDAIVRFYGRCAVPIGDTILASSPTAVVYGHGRAFAGSYPDPTLTYMGCLAAVGRERLLERFGSNSSYSRYNVVSATVAGSYAALVINRRDYFFSRPVDAPYEGVLVDQFISIRVYDLRTGRLEPGLGGEITDCGGLGLHCGGQTTLNHLVLGTDGVSAVHIEGALFRSSTSVAHQAPRCA